MPCLILNVSEPATCADSLTGSDEEDEPPSGKRGRRRGKQQLGPKKVGRPITFQGDINDPALTDADRRRIKRRARTASRLP